MELSREQVQALIDLSQSGKVFPYEEVFKAQGSKQQQEFYLALQNIARQIIFANEIRRETISNVSHELRTPISAIRNISENLVDGIIEPDKKNLRNILTQSEKITDLLAFMLDTSRVEAGVIDLKLSEFNIKHFLKSCTQTLTHTAKKKNVKFKIEVEDEKLKITADEIRLSQLIINLLTNAIKYSPENGTVFLRATEKPKDIYFYIIDQGPGVESAVSERIFNRFETSNADSQGGTGIGLSIAQWAAQLHNGSIKLIKETEDENIGAVFEVRIPK